MDRRELSVVMTREKTRPTQSAAGLPQMVYSLVARVPRGRVVTYGQLALLAGRPRAARLVGWLAHAGPPTLPWQRVVNRFGGLARGYAGGRNGHRLDLERDGVAVREDGTVDLARYQWWPAEASLRRLRRRPAKRGRPRGAPD